MMKAVVFTEYGPSEVLSLQEVERPAPKANEVLIRVHAVSLNASDWEALTGKPLYARIYGLFKPKFSILGSDIAGYVVAAGKDVTRFKVGDAVFGDLLGRFGGFAEYVCAPEDALLPKPAGLTFEQAAALPQGAVIALQGLRDKGNIQPGQKVLINGAGGSAGSFALQLAGHFGAEVTGVDNTEKQESMREFGADHVIDYTREDFTKNGQRYDLILDLAAHHSIFDCRRALAPGGTYLLVGGSMAQLLQVLCLGPLLSVGSGQKLGLLAVRPLKGVDDIIDLCDAGSLRPAIDRCYSLHEVPEALRYFGEGHAKGKVVISVKEGD